MVVNEDVVELDAFALQSLKDEVVGWPKGVLGERAGAQSVLIADHHKAEVGFFTKECQPAEDTRLELDFLERVNLLVVRLFYERAVTVNKEYAFHNLIRFLSFSSVSMLP